MSVAAVEHRQESHPTDTGSSLSDEYVTGHLQGPKICVQTPGAMLSLS